MLDGDSAWPQVCEEENLFYKINHRLVRLYEVMWENRESAAKERADLQELISDISHQVKTPISNLKMVNATLLEQPMPEEKQREFLQASGGQLEKLDFLMQAMIKTSHLETGVISLDRRIQPLYDTPADGDIQVSVQSWEFYVKIHITDSGKGIAESRQGMIFKRFYREEEVHDVEGIGIGLYLAREIVTMQGGYMKVTSTPGSGSTFSVFLPHG